MGVDKGISSIPSRHSHFPCAFSCIRLAACPIPRASSSQQTVGPGSFRALSLPLHPSSAFVFALSSLAHPLPRTLIPRAFAHR